MEQIFCRKKDSSAIQWNAKSFGVAMGNNKSLRTNVRIEDRKDKREISKIYTLSKWCQNTRFWHAKTFIARYLNRICEKNISGTTVTSTHITEWTLRNAKNIRVKRAGRGSYLTSNSSILKLLWYQKLPETCQKWANNIIKITKIIEIVVAFRILELRTIYRLSNRIFLCPRSQKKNEILESSKDTRFFPIIIYYNVSDLKNLFFVA